MNSVSVRLREWKRLLPSAPEGAELRGRWLRDEPARRTAALLSERRLLEVTELKAGLSIRAFAYVGRIRLGDLTITVVPKLGPSELLELFRYAYGLRDLQLRGTAEFDVGGALIQDLITAQLYAEVAELVRRGLAREYVGRRDWLESPRGRVDMAGLASPMRATSATLPCRHHPRTPDHMLNQVLLAGLQLATRVALAPVLRASVRRLAARLETVVSPAALSVGTLSRAHRHVNRLSRKYQPALELTELLYLSRSISLDDGGVTTLPGFLFDMNRFFQSMLGRLLRENLPGLDVAEERSLSGMMRYLPGHNPRGRRPPTPRPDFTVSRGDRVVQILDAKYRDLWEQSLPREMLYQLSVYALSHPGCPRAAILYPTTAPEARTAIVEIRTALGRTPRAWVELRPLLLPELAQMIRRRDAAALKRLAARLAFGDEQPQPVNAAGSS